MKKTFKRLGAALLAMAMAVSVLCTGALADDNTGTVTVPDNLSGHTFVAYQIFTGTQANGDTKLASVNWGTNINSTTFLTALVAGNIFESITTESSAADVAAELGKETDKSVNAQKFAKLAFNNKQGEGTALNQGSNTLPQGYYLIVDTTNTDDGTDVAKNTALLQVTNKTTSIEVKTGVPTVDKKVNDKEYDSANIGEEVEFTLTGTLPDNYEDFDKYVYEFQDTLSAGLDFVAGSVVVKVGDTEIKKVDSTTATDGYYITEPADGNKNLNISFADLTKIKDKDGNDVTLTSASTIVVTYKAKLNSEAVVGKDGNTNEVKLKYSNDPNGDGTGTTTPDVVKVFTLRVTVDKVKDNTDGEALKGAGFTLYKKDTNGEYQVVKLDENGKVNPNGSVEEIKGENLTHFAWSGLGEGDYKLVETTVPAGYNKADDLEFTISITDVAGEKANMVLNTVSAGDSFTQVTEGTDTFVFNTKVVNKSGSQLPSTGGMGTTLFYIIGGVLMAGAAVVLVIKKKRSSAE